MKKIIWVFLAIVCLLSLPLVYFLLNREYNYITIDINPSIKLYLDENNDVKRIEALNDEAKDIINFKLEGKSIIDTVNTIVEKAYEKGSVRDNNMDIVLYSNTIVDFHGVIEKVNGLMSEKNININVLVVDSISKEDEELARKEGITPAKASLINEAINNQPTLEVENLVDKSIGEIRESKETGKYCPEGYVLHGDWCEKAVYTYEGLSGNVCPRDYFEYNGECYLEGRQVETGNLLCEEEFTLEGEDCIKRDSYIAEPIYKCDNGLELGTKRGTFGVGGIMDGDTVYCIDKSNAVAPTLRCLTHNHIMIGDKCANGPKPVLPFGCEDGDYLVNGGCYDIDTYDQYVCPDGNIYEKSKGSYVELCPDTFTYYESTITGYKCQGEDTIEGSLCIRVDKRGAYREVSCDGEGTLIDNRCLILNDKKEKIDGVICDRPASREDGGKCIVYEEMPALGN